jgi:hypothetical protein
MQELNWQHSSKIFSVNNLLLDRSLNIFIVYIYTLFSIFCKYSLNVIIYTCLKYIELFNQIDEIHYHKNYYSFGKLWVRVEMMCVVLLRNSIGQYCLIIFVLTVNYYWKEITVNVKCVDVWTIGLTSIGVIQLIT